MSGAHATLEDLLARLGEADEIPSSMERHARSCDVCGRRLATARRLIAAARVANVSPPSDVLIDRTWDRIARARLADAVGEKLRVVLARLVGDSTAPTHALRGDTTAHARVLVFETDDVGISVALGEPDEQGVSVRGQVMPRRDDELPGEGRAILAVRAESREAPLDDFGSFDLGVVPADTLHLAFTLGETRVQLPPVDLRGER